MPKTPDQIFADKVKFLLGAEKDMRKAVNKYQRDLYNLIASEYLPLFKLENGVVLDSLENVTLVNQIDRYFDKLNNAMNKDVLSVFAKSLLEGVNLSAQYYVGLGFKKTIVDEAIKNKVLLEKRIGITPKGRLDKKGYLYKLGRTEEVRLQLRDYVTKSLTGDVSFYNFQLGLRNLVVGNRRVKALDVDGALQKHFATYAYDNFNAVDALANKQIASELNLEHFVYEGSTIETSRAFCRKRAGKAFTVKETKQWKNDPDLIDKKRKNSYKPLIDRGRYRCRHFIKYITKELYEHLTGK